MEAPKTHTELTRISSHAHIKHKHTHSSDLIKHNQELDKDGEERRRPRSSCLGPTQAAYYSFLQSTPPFFNIHPPTGPSTVSQRDSAESSYIHCGHNNLVKIWFSDIYSLEARAVTHPPLAPEFSGHVQGLH